MRFSVWSSRAGIPPIDGAPGAIVRASGRDSSGLTSPRRRKTALPGDSPPGGGRQEHGHRVDVVEVLERVERQARRPGGGAASAAPPTRRPGRSSSSDRGRTARTACSSTRRRSRYRPPRPSRSSCRDERRSLYRNRARRLLPTAGRDGGWPTERDHELLTVGEPVAGGDVVRDLADTCRLAPVRLPARPHLRRPGVAGFARRTINAPRPRPATSARPI